MAILSRLFLIVFLLCHVPSAHAEGLQLEEQEIKVGLLYNFLKYTNWPGSAISGSSVTVCVFGSDPFDGHLAAMAGRTVNQREIAIRMVHTVSDAKDCQLLFINGDESRRWPEIHTFLKGSSVLTISDYAGFAAAGGIIEFGHRNDHISADLNMDAAASARLNIEERMLHLVTVMHPGGGTP